MGCALGGCPTVPAARRGGHYCAGGHAIVWGASDWVDFRITADDHVVAGGDIGYGDTERLPDRPSAAPEGPQFELSVEGVPMGSVLQIAGKPLQAIVSVIGATRARLRLVGEFGVLLEQVVGEGEHELMVDPSQAGRFLGAELHHDEHGLVLALTDPVHLPLGTTR